MYIEIRKQVLDISRLTVEASIYIHFMIMRSLSQNTFSEDQLDFNVYFMALREIQAMPRASKKVPHPDTEIYALDDTYRLLRGDIPFVETTEKGNMIRYAWQQYETNFNNNIWMHGYTRVRKFLYHKIRVTEAGISKATVFFGQDISNSKQRTLNKRRDASTTIYAD